MELELEMEPDTPSRSIPLALVRIAVGAVFILTGLQKLGSHAAEARHFHAWGVPAPSTAVWLIAIIELVAGLLLATGLASRAAALVLSVDMIGAFATAGLTAGGMHLLVPPLLFVLLIVLVVRGGGRWQLLDRLDPAEPVR